MVIINCDLFAKQIEENGVKHFPIWKKGSFAALRYGKFFRKLHLYKAGNINPDLNNLDSEDCIIVFDSGIEENSVLKWFANKYSDKRLIFYYWNPVFTGIKPNKIPSKFELWSYSPSDCKKYGMKYNSTFYFDCFGKTHVDMQRDVFFIGKDKGRGKRLRKIEKFFNLDKLSYLFYLVPTHPRLKSKKSQKPRIPYEKMLDYINESRAVLDYYIDPQAGLSLRTMESIFFEKKLITNNETIVGYDIYNVQNVYTIEDLGKRNLKEFLASPFVSISEEIRNKYLFSNWIKRFFI